MGSAISRKIVGVSVFLLLHFIPFAQQIKGVIVDHNKQPVFGLHVKCADANTKTDFNGNFTINCKNSLLVLSSIEYDTITINWHLEAQNDTFLIPKNRIRLDEIEIVRQRLLHFDIGYLPPIKGVQIATGTNTILQTERQGGAKSSANPRELFAKVPGLNIWESDGAGIQMGVGGRGLSPNRAANFNMRQNGYDISADALGYPESYYTPPLEALTAIEIIRGSASLQYGTQFGGLMNFIIREPVRGAALEFTSRNTGGNYGYFGTFNRVSGSKGRFEYQVYHQYKRGDGYRPNSKFSQHQVFAQVGYHFNEKHHVRLEFTKMYYLAKQPGGLTDYMFNEDHRQSVRDRNWFKVDWNILALHYDWEISSSLRFNVRAFGMLSNRYSLGFLGKINQADPGGNREMIQGDFKNAGIEARILKEYTIGPEKKVKGGLLVGARFYSGNTTSIQGKAADGDDANFTFLNRDNVENSYYFFPSQNLSFFAENIFFLGEKWSINVGLRIERISSASEGFYKQYVIHELNHDTLAIYKIEDEKSLTRLVPLGGIGASFKTGKRSSLYTNFCMNYRAINFNDIRVVNPNIIVDTTIRDEFGSTTELGWRGFITKYWYADLAGFYLFYGNKIGLAPQGVKKIRTNIGDAVNVGVELFSEFDFIKSFKEDAKLSSSIFVNFAYINAKYIRSSEPNYIGKQVEYVSPIIARAGLKVRQENWQVQVQGSYNSAQFSDASNAVAPSGDAVIGQIPRYFVMDFSARYNFKKYFQLEAGVNNLLNTKYYTRRATAYPGPGILPSDGISFYLTLQFQIRTK